MSGSRGTPELRHALARKIRELRLKKGITQERLAFLAGLHPTYISMLENGRKSPTVDALERIARALGAKISSILAGAEQS
jgi:transcriptional regulator with XRE-family HTH domain